MGLPDGADPVPTFHVLGADVMRNLQREVESTDSFARLSSLSVEFVERGTRVVEYRDTSQCDDGCIFFESVRYQLLKWMRLSA